MAALNMAGYDSGLFVRTGDDTRQDVRDYLAKQKIPVEAQLRAFYAAHRNANDPGKDFAQYVSLALLLGNPPQFQFTIPAEDLPPDASDIRDLVPLVETFYQQAGLRSLYARLQPRYADAIQRYAGTVRREIALSDAYLRFPSGSYLGRTYHIYLCLMGAPDQVQARIYGDNYYLVVTPSQQPRFKEIRHQYLHFLLDPLAVKYGAAIHQKASLAAIARKAPLLDGDFKNDFSLLVTECLIHAVELRMDKPASAQQQANADLTSGLILTPYFYAALADYEKQDAPISVYYQQMIQGIAVAKMEKQLASVKFANPKPASQPAASAPLSAKDQLLDQGDNFIYIGKYDQAKQVFKQVLKQYDPKSARALFGVAVAASNTREPDIAVEYFNKALATAHNLRIVTWSHIYLARIYDIEGMRQKALAQYRAASITAATFPEALAAVQQGLQRPFDGSAR
ncbi:MAG TPA: tetratricopeptide repeat protein [Terriglobia bacterium]|nr:tetratricopeptide repeat protein [Terriglobia bacterium]